MRPKRIQHRRLPAGLLVLGSMLGLAAAGRAQELGLSWFRLFQPPEVSAGVDVEGSRQTSKVNNSKSTYDQISVTPLVGLQTQGYVYHPNLLTFNLNGDLGWGWNETTSSGSGPKQTMRESQDLARYLAQVNILSAKPYNATLYSAQDHTYADYGTFSTYTVDSKRYGGAVNYSSDRLTLTLDAGYRNENNSGLTGDTEVNETFVNFLGTDRRQSGVTTLTYHLNHYDNTVNNGTTQDSTSQTVGVSDSETLGSRKQIVATTGMTYGQTEYSGQSLRTVTATEGINVNHRQGLDSFFNANYSYNEMDPVTESNVRGIYGIRHQLYESLTSEIDAHGNYQDYSSSQGNATYDRYGVGLSENYTKRVGSWGRLSMGEGLVGDHQDQDSSGSILTTIDEPHQLYVPGSPNYRPTYLDHPNVILSSVVVRGPGGIPTQLNVDYTLTQVGQLTQIQLIQTSTVLHNGDMVTVTYESDSLNNASFESISSSTQIRLDLFGKFGVYGRLNWLDNNAPPRVTTETLTDWVLGVDYFWRWFRAGAEYEDYNSNYTEYEAYRFFQSFNFNTTVNSTLTVDLTQSLYRYSQDNSQDQYMVLARYNVRLPASLDWFVEGGYNIMDLTGSQSRLATARTGLGWRRGKLSIRTGYEYNNQNTTSSGQPDQEFSVSRFFLYLKRSF